MEIMKQCIKHEALYDRATILSLLTHFDFNSVSSHQPAITCSKLTIETLEQRCEICSKLTIKTPKRCLLGFFIVNFEHILELCSSFSIVNFE